MDLARLTVAPEDEPRFRTLMDEHHYLGSPWKIGQTVWHVAEDGSSAQAQGYDRLDEAERS